MVRVGGGWVALDEFLVKNDPCRGMSNCLEKKIFFFDTQKKIKKTFFYKKIYLKDAKKNTSI